MGTGRAGPASSALVLCAALCLLARGDACAQASFESASGSFVAVAEGAGSASITIQRDERLMAYALRRDVVVRERADDGPWRSASLESIAPGEPLLLAVDPAGFVWRVDAAYATVTTRLVTQHGGYLVTTAGQAYRLVGRAALVQPGWELGTYLRMRVDPATAAAFDVSASSRPFAGGPPAQTIAVTITVSVPLNTPTSDVIYIASDAGNWVPNGLRMSPLSGDRWTATLPLGKGTVLKYKYTRGSWSTAESNRSGIEIPNRSLTVTKTEATQTVDDAVARWSDLPS